MTFNPKEEFFRAFASAGVELFTFEATSDYDYYRLSKDAWLAADRFDYAGFDERMDMVLRAAPNAKVFPRMSLCSPPWWDMAHPDQLLTGADGKLYSPAPNFGWVPTEVRETDMGTVKMTVPSFASQQWIADSGRALQRFIRHAEAKYGDHIVGYHLISGGSEEWYYWGAFENTFGDTSRPQLEAFRRHLAARGWAGAETATIPELADRLKAEYGVFRDPADPKARAVIEFLRSQSEVLVDCISRFAAMTREVIGPDKFIGVFYGYFVDLCRHRTCWHNSGHLAVTKFLADPNVDFNASPTSYKDRRMGEGFSAFNSVTESHNRHGKLWWNENDILTHLSPALKDPLFHHPRTPVETQHIQRREFGNVLCHGMGTWWFDMWGGYYADAAIMADIARMVEIGRKFVHCDRTPTAEIAVALDDDSVHFTECDNRLTVPLIPDQLAQLAHAGAPFSTFHVDDLPVAGGHKFYIFPNLFHVSDERMTRILDVIRRPGVTSLFLYAPGIVGDSAGAPGSRAAGAALPDLARMERLTGIRLVADLSPAPLKVTVAGKAGLPKCQYGIDQALAPVIYAADPKATVLGTIAGGRRGAPRGGLVRKKIGRATSIFSAAGAIPADVLRGLAKSAGVHIFTAGGEVVYANASFLAISALPGKPVTLGLPQSANPGKRRAPRPGKLYELFHNKELTVPAAGRKLPPSPDGTWTFFRAARRDWDAINP
jgi:hypothetical protein